MQSKNQLLKIYSRPQLKEPFLVAAGPGTANVGLRAAGYLREKLESSDRLLILRKYGRATPTYAKFAG
jgi:proteasome assembly chaperone (PAC2) family protein